MKSNLDKFIEEEKMIFKSYNTGIIWSAITWNISDWLFHRGSDKILSFKSISRFNKKLPDYYKKTDGSPLPLPYMDFSKALICYLKRTKNSKYASITANLNELKRIYLILYQRGEVSPENLSRWHFDETLNYLKLIEYKNIYDSATNLNVISNIIDIKKITSQSIGFNHGIKSKNHYYTKKTISQSIDDRPSDKLPSYEAMKSYALCTNNPIDDNEEILLRVIDLLIVTGMRGNEVCYIPFDCWVEKIKVDKLGNPIKDSHGKTLKNIGIRYYAEKKFQDRVHWLAPQDIPLAKRAVNRLKELTKEAREIAKWQEQNPNRIWNIDPDKMIIDFDIRDYLGFNRMIYLQGFLKRKEIKDYGTCKDYFEFRTPTSKDVFYSKWYKAGDIEKVLLKSKLINKGVLVKDKNIILKTSDLLAIRFEGAFRFKRESNTFKVYPGKVNLLEINYALGVNDSYQSIFERRNLKEADGSKIRLTSHQPRHWRNTLYELAGMSNVQQALAMGRQNISQNKAYQHTTIKEKTKLHQEYLSFNSVTEKVSFLHNGIRNRSILGEMTETYHLLKDNKGIDDAESFLKAHGLALHLTPFGGCTHDFSQSPCQKHLQCWNNCSHLHRTNTPGETERLEEQLKYSKMVLSKMKNETTNSVWLNDLKTKINNIEKALKLKPIESIKVFPEGEEVTIANNKKRNSSV